ncbi:MAG: hypothetical protein ACLTLQ_03460 [[Clostridium] scindens]
MQRLKVGRIRGYSGIHTLERGTSGSSEDKKSDRPAEGHLNNQRDIERFREELIHSPSPHWRSRKQKTVEILYMSRN